MKNSNFSRNIAFGGIFTALSILLIYLAATLPINKLIMLGLASCIIPLSIITTNIKNSLIVYTASSILSLFIVLPTGITLSYIMLFGIYGFIKYLTEKLRNAPVEILLKLLFFNSSVLLTYSIYSTLFTDIIKINLPTIPLIIVLQFIFVVYDYILTVFINYANKNLLNKLK
jgi:hypothetical protein